MMYDAQEIEMQVESHCVQHVLLNRHILTSCFRFLHPYFIPIDSRVFSYSVPFLNLVHHLLHKPEHVDTTAGCIETEMFIPWFVIRAELPIAQ